MKGKQMRRILTKISASMLSMLVSISGFASPSNPLFDSHVHLESPENFPDRSVNGSQAVEALTDAGVDRAFALSAGYRLRNLEKARIENDFVASEVAKYPNRLIGFCGVFPFANWAPAELERCKHELSFQGVKVHTNTAGIDLANPDHLMRLEGFLGKASELGLIVLIHSGQWSERATLNFMGISIKYPGAKYILGHALFDEFRRLILIHALKKEMPSFGDNVYVEFSGTIAVYADSPEAPSLVWHLRKIGIDRVLFGSDFPVFTVKESYDALTSYGFSNEELRKIMSHNFQKILADSPLAAKQDQFDKRPYSDLLYREIN
jgi:uncharacterized protein